MVRHNPDALSGDARPCELHAMMKTAAWLIAAPAPGALSKATVLVRLAVGVIFFSEGVQKFLFSEALGAGRFARIGIPSTLHDLGLEESRLAWVAEQSIGIARLIQNNPRPLNLDEMRNLVAAAYHGDRSSLN